MIIYGGSQNINGKSEPFIALYTFKNPIHKLGWANSFKLQYYDSLLEKQVTTRQLTSVESMASRRQLIVLSGSQQAFVSVQDQNLGVQLLKINLEKSLLEWQFNSYQNSLRQAKLISKGLASSLSIANDLFVFGSDFTSSDQRIFSFQIELNQMKSIFGISVKMRGFSKTPYIGLSIIDSRSKIAFTCIEMNDDVSGNFILGYISFLLNDIYESEGFSFAQQEWNVNIMVKHLIFSNKFQFDYLVGNILFQSPEDRPYQTGQLNISITTNGLLDKYDCYLNETCYILLGNFTLPNCTDASIINLTIFRQSYTAASIFIMLAKKNSSNKVFKTQYQVKVNAKENQQSTIHDKDYHFNFDWELVVKLPSWLIFNTPPYFLKNVEDAFVFSELLKHKTITWRQWVIQHYSSPI
ncbi:UNKNOWN [Stylonychia lemnae]|uniref:Uncharacterized protein n=1 Tax=Stylonychia lemnae TaxID=5949 RepID=A0A078A4G9_STYLE|nr:UNKNOWN [Stylonychia lemnae]|eukprot:CDW75659.1 UNKNOWN [Stylonychia lemnae]